MDPLPEQIYSGSSITNLIVAHLFKFRDTTKGFEESNREYFKEFAHSVMNDADLLVYERSMSRVDPVMPLSMYDPDCLFYENTYLARDQIERIFTQAGVPRRYFRHDLARMTPYQLLCTYKDCADDSLDLSGDRMNDEDSQYISFISSEFVDAHERRRLETEEPYLWVIYTTKKVSGCEHYWRDAFPVCAECKKIYPCRLCHDENEDSHTMDRKCISEMYCLSCKKIVPIGMSCSNCGKVVSVIFCDTCHVMCQIGPDMKPAYHCDACGVCRVGLKKFSTHCDQCNSCFDARNFDSHICVENCSCPVCYMDLKDTIAPEFSMRCNVKHRIHASCYDKLIQAGTFVCPLDHKVIIDDDQYAFLRGRALVSYRSGAVPITPGSSVRVAKYLCYDCNTLNYDFAVPALVGICHGCFGINCRILTDFYINYDTLLPLLKDDTAMQREKELGTFVSFCTANAFMEKKPIEAASSLAQDCSVADDVAGAVQHLLEYRRKYFEVVPPLKVMSALSPSSITTAVVNMLRHIVPNDVDREFFANAIYNYVYNLVPRNYTEEANAGNALPSSSSSDAELNDIEDVD